MLFCSVIEVGFLRVSVTVVLYVLGSDSVYEEWSWGDAKRIVTEMVAQKKTKAARCAEIFEIVT